MGNISVESNNNNNNMNHKQTQTGCEEAILPGC